MQQDNLSAAPPGRTADQMSKAVKDSFLDLEKHRQLLEENIEKLRKSLLHWQIWEAEYEGLKEEIISVGPEPSKERLLAIGREFGGKLVTQAEVEDILGIKIPRSADQVTNLISRRIDYVSQNVKTLEKQLETAENKLAAATVISNPDVRNEDGLPMTEIIEELDEDGNVISSRTETQGSARGQLLEVLEKAGVKDLPGTEREPNSERPSTGPNTQGGSAEDEVSVESVPSEISEKSVQFSEGTKEGPETRKSQTAQRIEAITNSIKKNNSIPEEPPIIPVNESPEDAALRKEMLQYGMSEVGAVVAELNLEDGSDSIDDDDHDDYDASSTEDDEDEFGRSTRKVIDDEMRRRMIELEEKLGLRIMENVGPNPNISIANELLSETPDIKETSKAPETVKEKKGVRFAEELDFAETPSKAVTSESKTKASSKSPVRDVVERAPSTQEPEAGPVPPQKISRFKSSRAAKPQPQDPHETSHSQVSSVPTKPARRPLADTIIEHEIPASTPPEPDELDPALLHQEVATEYHRMRNRMIQRQGGFMKDPELENGIISLTEEEGGSKKMSRFKAARLARG
jgi:unconventional prefoldin RPB5 interactor 1